MDCMHRRIVAPHGVCSFLHKQPVGLCAYLLPSIFNVTDSSAAELRPSTATWTSPQQGINPEHDEVLTLINKAGIYRMEDIVPQIARVLVVSLHALRSRHA